MNRSFHLTADTITLIEALFKTRSLMNYLRKPSPGPAELMSQIAASAEIEAMPYLLAFATTATPQEAQRAADTAAALLATLNDVELIYIDQNFRRHSWYLPNIAGRDAWQDLKPEHLDAIAQRVTRAESLLGFASMHHSGRIREKAVRLLSECNSGAELSFLFLRLNDWVDIIATLAASAIRKRLVPELASVVAGNVAFVQRLTTLGRVDHRSLFNTIVEFLAQPECRPQVEAALHTADTGTRKIIFAILTRTNGERAQQVVLQALMDAASIIRLWAIRKARQDLHGEAQAEAIDLALKDRSSAVRTAAVYALVDTAPEKLVAVLLPMLMAPTPALRSIARFHLAKINNIDLRAFYAGQLSSTRNRDVEIAVLSLGDIANHDDVPLLLKHLHDTRPRISAAAIRGLARIAGDDFVAEFTAVLLSRDGFPAKQAMQALLSRAYLINQELIWGRFQQTGATKPRARMLQLLAHTNKWDALYYIMAARGDGDAVVAALADDMLNRWTHQFNSSTSTPSPEQKLRAQKAVDSFSQDIESHRLEQLQFLLR